jgi:hypothetical protein
MLDVDATLATVARPLESSTQNFQSGTSPCDAASRVVTICPDVLGLISGVILPTVVMGGSTFGAKYRSTIATPPPKQFRYEIKD